MLVNVVFILTGCESKKEIKEVEEIVENVEQNTQVVDETLVKINGLEFHMNKETSYKDVKYTKCFVEYNASWLGEKITGQKACW